MAKGWYVVHTYSGYENKIEKTIRKLMEDPKIAETVFDIKVPSEEVVEVKDGKRKTSMKKILPGYILLEMDLPNIGWKYPCSMIRRIQGVTGFVGSRDGSKPQPISDEEARRIFQKTGDIKSDKQPDRDSLSLLESGSRSSKVRSIPSPERWKRSTSTEVSSRSWSVSLVVRHR